MKIITHATLITGKPGKAVVVPPGTYERDQLQIADDELEGLRARGLLGFVEDEPAPAPEGEGEGEKK